MEAISVNNLLCEFSIELLFYYLNDFHCIFGFKFIEINIIKNGLIEQIRLIKKV